MITKKIHTLDIKGEVLPIPHCLKSIPNNEVSANNSVFTVNYSVNYSVDVVSCLRKKEKTYNNVDLDIYF